MDLISPDYDKLLKKIKGKNVFFDATNIFGYHMSHAYYTLGELVSSYKKLQGVLGQANKTYFRGTSPTKQKINAWSVILEPGDLLYVPPFYWTQITTLKNIYILSSNITYIYCLNFHNREISMFLTSL